MMYLSYFNNNDSDLVASVDRGVAFLAQKLMILIIR